MGIQERDYMRRARNEGDGPSDPEGFSGGEPRGTWRPVVLLFALLTILFTTLSLSKQRNHDASRSSLATPVNDSPAIEAPKAMMDVNHASRDDLLQIPFLREKVVDAIITSRPYASVDDVIRAYGVGPKTLERLRPYITVSPGSNTALERPSPP